jgi:hypothetical protein
MRCQWNERTTCFGPYGPSSGDYSERIKGNKVKVVGCDCGLYVYIYIVYIVGLLLNATALEESFSPLRQLPILMFGLSVCLHLFILSSRESFSAYPFYVSLYLYAFVVPTALRSGIASALYV